MQKKKKSQCNVQKEHGSSYGKKKQKYREISRKRYKFTIETGGYFLLQMKKFGYYVEGKAGIHTV